MRRLIQLLREDTSGQAMAEYAIVVACLMGGLVALGAGDLPNLLSGGVPADSSAFLVKFINAIQKYYDNFYIILNLPIP